MNLRWISVLVILLSVFTSTANPAPKTPDFSTFPDSERLQKINEWYLQFVRYQPDTNTSWAMLDDLLNQANKHKDPIMRESNRFYKGMYLVDILKREEGMSMMNEAIAEFDRLDMEFEWASCMHELSVVYYIRDNNAKSLELQIRAYEVFKKIGFKKTPDIHYIQFDLAYLYYHLGNYSSSLELLLPSVPYLNASTGYGAYVTKQILNTIGLSYRELQKNDSARYYFERTMDTARFYKDSAWIAIAAGNLGSLYISQGEYDKALPYIRLSYQCAVAQERWVGKIEIGDALATWAEINIAKGNINEAFGQLKRAEGYLETYSSTEALKMMKHLYEMLTKVYIIKKDFGNALRYQSLTMAIGDSIMRNHNVAQYVKLEVQLEAESNIAKINQLETENRLSVQRRNFSLAGLALGALFLFTLYNSQRLKNRKDKELHQSREQLLYSEKLRAEEQLTGYMENLHEKNRIIEEFETERERLNLMPNGAEKLQTIETIEKLQKSTIITEDEWIQFKSMFDKVHKGFFTRLKEKYPDLTQAEIRLLALTKLNLSTKEMAGILGISPESIRKARYRFLKKVNDTSGEADIPQIVNSI